MARETRLGKALRELPIDAGPQAVRRDRIAGQLDATVLSLNCKGEAIKSLRSYAAAVRFYEEVTGTAYVPRS